MKRIPGKGLGGKVLKIPYYVIKTIYWEQYFQRINLTLLGADSTYFIKSEDENNKGYVDIMLKRKIQFKDITKFQWIIELKYIKESDKNTLEKVEEEGLK